MKSGFNEAQKNTAREETANIKLKFSEDNPQSNFWNSFTFITLQYCGGIPGVFLKQRFVECSSDILEMFPCDY